jgi:Ca2+-binding RTX toxin-like protein
MAVREVIDVLTNIRRMALGLLLIVPTIAVVAGWATAVPACTITGADSDERLSGTGGSDVICGLKGDDRVHAGRGNDWVVGGGGDDLLRGGRGEDHMNGGPGRDRLFGGAGRDRIDTHDTYPNDIVHGGGGDDRCLVDSGDAVRGCTVIISVPSS